MNNVKSYIVLSFSAVLAALNYHVFILPNAFAPAGLNGLATMIQYLFQFSIGYMSLLINIPLCIFAYIKVGKSYAIRTTIYNVVFSVLLIFFQYPIFDFLIYQTTYSQILGPIVSGIITGYVYGIVFRINGSTGGLDIIAAYVHKCNPTKGIFQIILVLNCVVATISYFVYDFNMEPVILCIFYCYFSSFVGDRIIKGGREVIRFEVVTEYAETLSAELLSKMHRGVTMLPAKGMYSLTDRGLLICVVDKRQIVDFINITQQYPNTFTCSSTVNQAYGNFAAYKP